MKSRKVFKKVLVKAKNIAAESLSEAAFKPKVSDTNKKKYNRKKIKNETDDTL